MKNIAFLFLLPTIMLSSNEVIEGKLTLIFDKANAYTHHLKRHKDLFHLKNLIETGTYDGSTAQKAAGDFDQVYTVEIHEGIYKAAAKKLLPYNNVHIFCDSSSNFLQYMEVSKMKDSLIFLDAHFSGPGTGTLYIQDNWVKSPLKEELATILKSFDSSNVILLDDVAGYLNLPFMSKMGREYPTIFELYEMVKSTCPSLAFYVIGDNALIYNTAQFNMAVSPCIEALTNSCVFSKPKPYKVEELEKVISSETFLMEVDDNTELSTTIDSLYRHVKNSKDGCCFYPVLWKTFRLMKNKNYDEAINNFYRIYYSCKEVFEDRLKLYLAICFELTGDQNSAEVLYTSIDPNVLTFKNQIFQALK